MKVNFKEPQWLYRRLKSSSPKLNPNYSFRGTVGWLRALAMLCDKEAYNRASLLSSLYNGVTQRNMPSKEADTTTCEFTFMALQNLPSLYVMKESSHVHDLARIAVVSWYYGVCFAAKSMIAAYDGSQQEKHSKTATAWNAQIVQRGCIKEPFSWNLHTLVKKEYEGRMEELGATFHLGKDVPLTKEEAVGACFAYLKGTADHERVKAENDIRRSKDFEKFGVKDFRKKDVQKFRDDRLAGKITCFLTQAFRYRGKANYRDALYLSYGRNEEEVLEKLLEDLYTTLYAFVLSAGCYCELRVEEGCWDDFLSDLTKHGRLSMPLDFLGAAK